MKNTLRWLPGEDQITHLEREYYEWPISRGPWVGKAAFELSKGPSHLR